MNKIYPLQQRFGQGDAGDFVGEIPFHGARP